jgi:BON domain
MKSKRVLIATTLVVLLSLGVIACSRAKSDAQIIGEVVTKIQSDSQVSDKQISVMSSNGVVTLAGSAANEAERAAVANDAAQVEGVKTVVNNLMVAGVPAPTQQADVQEPQPTPAPPVQVAAPARARKPAAYREHHVSTPAKDKDAYVPPVTASGPTYTNTPYVAPTTTPVANSTPAPPPAPKPVTIEQGTVLSIRMVDAINSGRNHPGDMFHATLDSPVMVGETVVIPEGADVIGRVVEVKDAGHFAGKPELALELTNLSVNGNKYTIKTDQYRQEGKSRGASTAKTVGTGAAIGGIIGAIAGGGKGAAIGAAAGAGMGGGVQATRKAEEVHIGTEALLSFQLQNSLTMTPAPASTRRRLEDSNYSSPPPPQDNRNYVDYSSDRNSSSNNSTDRPVLKRRPQSTPDQEN